MLPLRYRLTLIGCVLSWFLVGLHLPALHQVTHHDAALHWGVLGIVGLLAGAALLGLWALLRVPPRPLA